MNILGKLNAQQFIERHWQRKPLLIRDALALPDALIDADELAGLACEDDVESRLVRYDVAGSCWQCEDGPFDEAHFANLPTSHWTLLVQGVDQHLPSVHALLAHFSFLPRWRVDDIMISYAVDGGGVGAHFDHYDVFLLQLAGTRRWQLGQDCNDETLLDDQAPLKLLKEFNAREEYLLEAGDMLYLPPGLAHCGTAVGDDCLTASIGYRSPSPRAIIERALELLAASQSDQPGYRDTAAAIDVDPYRINPAAMALAQAMLEEMTPARIAAALQQAFGAQVTEPRQVDLIQGDESIAPERLDARIAELAGTDEDLLLSHHAASRLAWTDGENGRCTLFIDGESWNTSCALARGICHGKVAANSLSARAERDLLRHLLDQGSLSLS